MRQMIHVSVSISCKQHSNPNDPTEQATEEETGSERVQKTDETWAVELLLVSARSFEVRAVVQREWRRDSVRWQRARTGVVEHLGTGRSAIEGDLKKIGKVCDVHVRREPKAATRAPAA